MTVAPPAGWALGVFRDPAGPPGATFTGWSPAAGCAASPPSGRSASSSPAGLPAADLTAILSGNAAALLRLAPG